MAAVIPSIQDILSLDLIPIVLNTTYEIKAFVMGYHVYKNTWTPFVGEALDVAMQPDNKMDKYAVAIFQERKKKSHRSSSTWEIREVCQDDISFLKS